MEYEVGIQNFKQRFILEKLPESAKKSDSKYFTMSETIRLPKGWSVYADGSKISEKTITQGNLFIKNRQGEIAFIIPLPEIHELSNPNIVLHPTGKMNQSFVVSPLENQEFLVKVAMPLAWLADENRNFPIVIDPTSTLAGGFGGWQNGSNFTEGNPNIFVFAGLFSGDNHRAYTQFDITSISDGASITSVALELLVNLSENPGATKSIAINDVTGALGPYGAINAAAYADFNNGLYTNVDITSNTTYSDITLGSQAATDLQGRLAGNVFQVALANDGGTWKRFTSNLNNITVVFSLLPRVASVSLAADNSSLDVTFNEAVYNTNGAAGALEISDFTLGLSGGSVTNPVITSITTTGGAALSGGETAVRLNFSITGTPDGGETLSVVPSSTSAIFNVLGNAAELTQSNNTVALNDKVGPTIAVAITDSALSISETTLVTFTFSEIVTGFTNEDITIPNGTLTAVNSADGGTTYTATFTPTANLEDAINVFTIAMTGTADNTGNTGTGTTDSGNFIIDTKTPTTTIDITDVALKAGETTLVTFTFSEVVTGFENADITIPNGTMTNVSSADGGTTYTATFTPTADFEDATNIFTMDKTGVTDNAGNTGTGSTDSSNFTIETKRPTVTIAITDADLKAGETTLVTFTFSEVVTGFENADITIPNGTMTNVSSADGGTTYTATFTPTDDLEDATNIFTVDKTGVTDNAGNTGIGTTDSNNFTINTKRPSVTIVITDTVLKVGEMTLVTFTFSEVVTGFENADITIPNGTMTNVSSADGGTTYTATFTPTNNIEDVTNAFTINKTGVTNNLGNTGTGTTDSNNFTIDTTKPTIFEVLTSSSADNKTYGVDEKISIYVQFSEPVTVTGSPQLTLETGTTDRTINYKATSSSTVEFEYTVQTGDESADLDYVATNSLTLNGGTIKDASGNDAILTLASPGTSGSLSAARAIVINASVPTVTTTDITTKAQFSALLGGNVTDGGGSTVTGRGIVFSETATNANPLISGAGVTQDSNGTGVGIFSESITGLSASTQYSYKAYATNSSGTVYGTVKTFTTSALETPAITFANINKTYGDANFDVAATSNSNGLISYTIEGANTTSSSLSGANNATANIGNVGSFTIRATQAANGIYASSTKDIVLTINKATLTATADDTSKEYGDVNPAFTISYAGFKGSDTVDDLDTAPTVSSTATTNTNAGTATITTSGGSDNNYNITLVNGTLTIGKVTITATADDTSKEYGDANPTFTISYTGFKGADSESDIDTAPTVSSTATETTNAGTTAITTSGGSDNNYNITLVNGTLTISKATLIASADGKSKEYGGANPAFTISYSGFKGSDSESDIDTTPTVNSTATTTTNAGTATITTSGGSDNNYNITLVDGTLTIGKATITVIADDTSKEYGDANPVFTISYTGFKGSDSASDLDTAPTVSSTATATTNAGTATITTSGGSDNNYTITTVNGTLTISKATLIVTAKNTTAEYGDNFSIGFAYGTFKNGEDASVLDTGAYVYIVGNHPYNSGTYTIVPDAVVDNNYTPSYVNGTLTVTKATITATANDTSKEYGDVNPAFTLSYSGFKGSDSASDLDTAPIGSSTASKTTNVGNAAITVSGGNDNNYTIATVDGTLTINKREITVTANEGLTKVAGETDPEFTYNVTSGSLANSDTFSGALSREVGELVGPYFTEIGTLTLGNNYNVTFVKSTFTVSIVLTTGYISRSSKGVVIAGKVSNLTGVVERGVVYSSVDMTPNVGEPDVFKVIDSNTTGPFTLTIDNLKSNTTYYFQTYVITTVSKATTPLTFYGGIKSFKTLVTEPTLVSKNITNGTLKVDPTTNLTLTFDSNMQAGLGNIIIKKTSDDSVIESIDVTSGNITITDKIVTINPTVDLLQKTAVYVIVPVGALENTSSNGWTGFNNKTDWTFTTDDTTAPTVTTFSPSDNNLSVAPDSDLIITFSEEIVKGTGNILVKKSADDSVIATIDVTSSEVSIANNIVTINPNNDLPSETAMYIEIPNTAFKDLYNNAYAGFASSTTWNFTTADITPPTIIISSPVSNPTNTTFTATFTFSEDVTDFVIGDITLGNATASNFTATSSAIYTALITPIADGTVTIDIAADVAADAATNGNSIATQFSTVYDATAPDMPIVIAIDDYTCAGNTTTTADNTLVFNGTAEASSSVEVFINNSSVGTTTTNGSGTWSFDYTSVTLADATYNITATATDAATNTSNMSAVFSIIIDTKDFDEDGNPDFCDTDDDNDGVLDADDNSYLPNPDQLDTDGDGLADVEEDCDNDGIVNYYDTDVASCQNGIVMKEKYGFSPNGDGVNDAWVIENIQLFPNNVVHIYNRSGKLVYTMKGYDNSFNGFSNKINSGKKLPVGAYYFTVEFNTPGAKPAKGWIYINY